ncbi:hypothetical protein AB4Y40_14085 [Paraburkholderia sp. EG287B]|uniref:hypothetical protein n=1 Tax=Paraburkholderia sp. EG287B TaxID=3237010 RepID=UPI0034D29C51
MLIARGEGDYNSVNRGAAHGYTAGTEVLAKYDRRRSDGSATGTPFQRGRTLSDDDIATLTALPPPTLSLDFIANPSIPSNWTFQRTSSATYYDANGSLVSATGNVPRFEYEPRAVHHFGALFRPCR